MQLFGRKEEKRSGFSKTKLLLGAGGLLLFIVGLKRSHRLDDQGGTVLAADLIRREPGPDEPPGASPGA